VGSARSRDALFASCSNRPGSLAQGSPGRRELIPARKIIVSATSQTPCWSRFESAPHKGLGRTLPVLMGSRSAFVNPRPFISWHRAAWRLSGAGALPTTVHQAVCRRPSRLGNLTIEIEAVTWLLGRED